MEDVEDMGASRIPVPVLQSTPSGTCGLRVFLGWYAGIDTTSITFFGHDLIAQGPPTTRISRWRVPECGRHVVAGILFTAVAIASFQWHSRWSSHAIPCTAGRTSVVELGS